MWTCWVCRVLGCGKHTEQISVDRDRQENDVVSVVVDPPKNDSTLDVVDLKIASDPARLVHHVAIDATVEAVEFDEETVQFTKTPSIKRFTDKVQARQDQIVKVDVHSGGGSEDGHEHEYEDIYMAQTEEARDSGKHSRTESTSSNNSTNMPSQQQIHSPESGVSSASPSDLGQSEEENEKLKLAELVKTAEDSDQIKNNLESSNEPNKYNTINSTANISNSSTMLINMNYNNNNNSTINRNSVKNGSIRSTNSTVSKNYSTGSVISLVEEVAVIEKSDSIEFMVKNTELIKSNTLNSKTESNKSINYIDDITRCNTLNGPITDMKMNGHQELNRASSVEIYGSNDVRRASTTSVESYGNRSLKKSSLNGSVEIIGQNLYDVKEIKNENQYGSKEKLPQTILMRENSNIDATENIYDITEYETTNYKDINGQMAFSNKDPVEHMSITVKEQNHQNSMYNNNKDVNGQNVYGGKELIKSTALTRSLNDINSANNIYVAPSLDSGIDDGDKLIPADLDENKLRLSLPNQTTNTENKEKTALKRVVSEPANMCPVPPPPPPPPGEEPSSLPVLIPLSVEESSSQTSHTNQLTSGSEGGQLAPHTLKKQLVLPFIPPKFGSSNDSNSLIKPSEYLRSISGSSETVGGGSTPTSSPAPPAPPPVPQAPAPPPPPPQPQDSPPKPPQPLSTISIHDLNSVQLRRTKQPAYKTMSCPPKSLTGVGDQPFLAQKEDLIAELKMSKDITGIKKLKVERVKMEEKQDKEIHTELAKQFSVENFVTKMPEKDSAGNPIPKWKREMLAKKAAEKARKEMEEQIAKETEEKRLQAIPAWKRHLLSQKKQDEKMPSPMPSQPAPMEEKKMEVEVKAEEVPENKENNQPEVVNKTEIDCKDEDEATQIIPWRAQLRKTNSTLNLLE